MNDYITMGTIILFAGDYAPQGWMYCNGATIAIQQYEALYAILGDTYGGDGSITKSCRSGIYWKHLTGKLHYMYRWSFSK